ncbi:BIR protein [Plasmodium berghei]|uniref:BIR protein n=2 Tax=Plasmodium berghei TaxID=5821 RepID=A0A509ACW9_PLABA|nr:BIR protein [Plasmodium berghei ANKA]CXH91519.1 BIR protein [Plasmodium berghei]SCL81425.1 BIR protein [Plasmodium berghei]SCL81667.1 BIR protein [Plasmodium berghei]SCL85354.1 BIR protein [Plasmodium berghei]SCN22055.1 BIR protein [Plasmodium berghei]|eukprot:XP_034419888.1 BIR protein [Plasmodium berghei ANKA]
MNDNMCRRFLVVRNSFPDQLNREGKYYFNDDKNFNKYCNNNCDDDLDKINAGCLLLFNELFGSIYSFNNHAKNNIDAVYYIIIWLSYMLSLKSHNNITNLNDFYNQYINKNEKYKQSITGVTEYNSYKEIIDKKMDLLNMDNNIISKFYAPFKLLYEMYTNFDENTSNCKTCSGNAYQFFEKYKELNGDSNNNDSSPYRKILSRLSTDYNNLKNKCKGVNDSDFPTLPEIKTTKSSVKSSEQAEKISKQTVQKIIQSSAQSSEVTSSNSSIGNKLFTVLSIFGAIAFFLGISYKYSLFGFRKRSQKQNLRENQKNKE